MHKNLRILTYPEPVLRKRCKPLGLERPSARDQREQLTALVRQMGELVIAREGVGLAAPQVGRTMSLFIINLTGEAGKEKVYIDPELIDLTGQEEAEEGCLSIPGVNVPIKRATHTTIRAVGLDGEPFEEHGEGLLVRVWQHEIDHLNGRLILDYMTPESKLVNRRAIQELQAEYDREHKTRKTTGRRTRRSPARRASSR